MNEPLISFRHTQAVILKFKESLIRIIRSCDILFQFLFILFYVYLLVNKIDCLPWTIAYSILIGISSSFLLFLLVTIRAKSDSLVFKTRKVMRRITKYSKFIVRAGIIGYNIYLIVTTEVTELNKLLVIFSVVILILQIVLDIAIAFINRYIDYIVESLKWDYEESPAVKKIAGIVKEEPAHSNFVTRAIVSGAKKWLGSGTSNVIEDKEYSEEEIKNREKIKEFEDKFINK